MPDLWLASQSPRRRELLGQIGVSHQVVNVDVPEAPAPGETPVDYVQRLALSKARAGSRVLKESCPVLGADTIVVFESRILEKPKDEADGLAMLGALSGNTHQVITAVAVSKGEDSEVIHCVSQVSFGPISPEQATRYWATGEPCDKAGGYGIQGLGAAFVAKVSGSYSNVVGLPLYETTQLLGRYKVPIWRDVEQ